MKTLNEIKEKVAKEEGHESWYDLKESWMTQKDILEGYMEDVAKRYAEQALDESCERIVNEIDSLFPISGILDKINSVKEQLK